MCVTLSENGKKLLDWLNKNPQEWFYFYQIHQAVGPFVDGALLEELYKHDFLLRVIAPDDENEPWDVYDEPPYSYRISDYGRGYLKSLLWKTIDHVLAIWGAITGTVAIIAEIVLHFL